VSARKFLNLFILSSSYSLNFLLAGRLMNLFHQARRIVLLRRASHKLAVIVR
jgi:hypothetical protein